MKIFDHIKTFYHVVVLAIFLIQSKQSLDKYLEYPVVIQKSTTSISKVKTPEIQVCYHTFFDYEKSTEFGYDWRSKFLAGLLPNSTIPSWKGKQGNSNFQKIQELIYDKDFSNVTVSKPNELIYVFGKGFCRQVKGFGRKLQVTSKEKEIKAYLVHKSTDKILISDKESPYSQIELGATSDTTFDYKAVELFYEVEDNTIFEGATCVDYREQEESYGDCNYKALASYFHDLYGCYPPWMKLGLKNICEIDEIPKNVSANKLSNFLEDLDSLVDGIKLDIMKQCLPPCYQVQVKWSEKEHIPNWKGEALLKVYDDTEIVPISKAVYSFDIFTLIVELGSALGLWLGNHMLNNV